MIPPISFTCTGLARLSPSLCIAALVIALTGCSPTPSPEVNGPDRAVKESAASAVNLAYQAPMEAFVLAYIKAAQGAAYDVDGQFQLPAVWLFAAVAEKPWILRSPAIAHSAMAFSAARHALQRMSQTRRLTLAFAGMTARVPSYSRYPIEDAPRRAA